MNRPAAAIAVLLLAGACQAHVARPAAPPAMARADLALGAGGAAGTASLLPRGDGTALVLELAGLPPGGHGIHFHAVGKCDGPGFATAGGHLNPAGRQHGHDNPGGAHLGDLPNVTADATGKVSGAIQLPVLPADLAAALFDGDGAAIVVHAAPDDYRTDPSGNSGARIACGVLIPG